MYSPAGIGGYTPTKVKEVFHSETVTERSLHCDWTQSVSVWSFINLLVTLGFCWFATGLSTVKVTRCAGHASGYG